MKINKWTMGLIAAGMIAAETAPQANAVASTPRTARAGSVTQPIAMKIKATPGIIGEAWDSMGVSWLDSATARQSINISYDRDGTILNAYGKNSSGKTIRVKFKVTSSTVDSKSQTVDVNKTLKPDERVFLGGVNTARAGTITAYADEADYVN